MSQNTDDIDGIETVYETAPDYYQRYGMSVTLGHHPESGTFAIGVFNCEYPPREGNFTVLEREELLRLRDAITRRLGS